MLLPSTLTDKAQMTEDGAGAPAAGSPDDDVMTVTDAASTAAVAVPSPRDPGAWRVVDAAEIRRRRHLKKAQQRARSSLR